MKIIKITLLMVSCLLGLAVADDRDENLAFLITLGFAREGVLSQQLYVGCRYEEGKGVEKDPAEAVVWYRKAAEQGCAAAQYRLAVCYEEGKGVDKDEKEAVAWYHKAAEKGIVAAQCELGRRYRDANLREALKWYVKAALQGNIEAQNALDEICDRYGYNRFDYGIADIQRKSVRSEDTAEENNDAGALCYWGKCYLYGWDGVSKDPQKAIRLLEKAAEQGFAEAQYRLADCYMYGRGTRKDVSAAIALYTEAADNGLNKAKTELAKCYLYGKGVKQDWEKGYSLLSFLPDRNLCCYLKEARYTQAKCLLYGWGVEQDEWRAKSIFRGLYDYKDAEIHLMEWYEELVYAANGNPIVTYLIIVCIGLILIGFIAMYNTATFEEKEEPHVQGGETISPTVRMEPKASEKAVDAAVEPITGDSVERILRKAGNASSGTSPTPSTREKASKYQR